VNRPLTARTNRRAARQLRSGRLTALACAAALVFTSMTGCGDRATEADDPATGVVSGDPAGAFGDDGPPDDTLSAPAESAAPIDVDSVNACELLSQAEAEQLAGTTLGEAMPVKATCTYPPPPSGKVAQVEVFIGPGAEKILDINRQLGHEMWELPGIGDEAYAEDDVAYLQKSGVWVCIRLVLLNDPAENRQRLEDAARLVASRI
jgi:hypothetical protein